MVSFLLSFLFVVVTGVPTLEELEKEIVAHIQAYDGLEFSIQSSYRFVPSKDNMAEKFDLPKCRETIRLHVPEKNALHKSWKSWVQEVQETPDDEWLVSRFQATDFAKTHKFVKAPPRRMWSNGSITPWNKWSEDEGRTFFTFLGMSTVYLSLLDHNVSDDFKSQVWERLQLQFVKEGECDGVKTFIFQREDTEFGHKLEVHFLSKGGFVVHVEATLTKEELKEHSVVYHVDKWGIFEGIHYPKSGYCRGQAMGQMGQTDYKFEVTAVKRYDKELLKNWFPEWLPATSVRDHGTGKDERIPPTGLQEIENWNNRLEQNLMREIMPRRY